jgi:hypothetical protein
MYMSLVLQPEFRIPEAVLLERSGSLVDAFVCKLDVVAVFLIILVYARFGFVFAYTPRLDLAVRSDTITMVHAGDLF